MSIRLGKKRTNYYFLKITFVSFRLNGSFQAIDDAGMTDSDLEDYIAWRIHMSVVTYLGDDWRETRKNFDEVVSGTSEQERWRTCSDAANG